MPNDNKLNKLIINRLENTEIYNYLLDNGLISDDELYFIEGEDEDQETLLKSGGTMTGRLVAKNSSSGESSVRNISFGDTLPSEAEDGEIFILLKGV